MDWKTIDVASYDKPYIGVFNTAEEAIAAAAEAQKTLMKNFTVEDRQRFIDAGGHDDKCTSVVGKSAAWVAEILEEAGKL